MDEKVFVYNCDLNLALFASMLVVLLYLDNLFINKLRTKCFKQNGFKYRENSQFLWKSKS